MFKKLIIALAVIALCYAATALAEQQPAADKVEQQVFAQTLSCKISHVYDGDRELIIYPSFYWLEFKKGALVARSNDAGFGQLQAQAPKNSH